MKLAGMLLVVLASAALAGDPTVDWLLNQPAGQPATRPSSAPGTQPATPLARPTSDLSSLRGAITLSDGTIHRGVISTTPGKPLRFWDGSINEYRDVPLNQIRSMDAQIVWERDEPEWHFKESGSDTKEFTGKTYPARETEYSVLLHSGQRFVGGVVAPLYVDANGQQRQHVLYKRSKGPVGQPLSKLNYVLKVELEGSPGQSIDPER